MARKAKTESNGKKRGRPAKSAKAKADQVEVREGELELKPVEIDDHDFDMHFAGVKQAKEKLESYQSKYRLALKSAKSVSTELHDAIKVALKFEKMGAEDVKRQLEIDGYVLKRQGSPVQITLHDALLGDKKDVAYKRGFNSGQNGQTFDNQYPAGSELHDIFATGWRNGMASNVKGAVPEQTNSGEELPIQ